MIIYNSSLSSIKKNRTLSLNGHLILPTNHESLHSFYIHSISAHVPTARPVVSRGKRKAHGSWLPNMLKGINNLPSSLWAASETMRDVRTQRRSTTITAPLSSLTPSYPPAFLSTLSSLPTIQIKSWAPQKLPGSQHAVISPFLGMFLLFLPLICSFSLIVHPSYCHYTVLCYLYVLRKLFIRHIRQTLDKKVLLLEPTTKCVRGKGRNEVN